MGQAGFGWRRLGFLTDGVPMGRQPIATLSDLAKEIRDTEDGLIFDAADNTYITLRGRRHMLNQTSKLDLTWPDDVSGLKEITDDLKVFNDVTVKNRRGGEANAVLADGPLGVATIGRVQTTVNVNVDTTQVDLQPIANYYLQKFTVDAPRFSAVEVDLDAHGELKDDLELVDIGDMITVTGRTPATLRWRVLQIAEQGRRKRRTVSFLCEPADIWYPAVLDDGAARMDARGHTLDGFPYLTTDTALSVNLFGDSGDGDGLLWTHADGDFNIDVGGEVCTVTAVDAGTPIQVLTVTRGVNGVHRTWDNGATVKLATPTRIAR
jgi:hypothetical protein